MSNIFQSIASRKPKLNKFNLSHEKKMSMKMGKLYPIMCQEIIPGDKFKVSSEVLLRMAPMVSPVMHRINVYTHYFFVPNRLVWNEWEDFITGGESGDLEPAFPNLRIDQSRRNDFHKGKLPDYMGIPLLEGTITETNEISALPFRAYAKIYNEYFRDQNLEEKIEFGIGGGLVPSAEQSKLCTIRNRAWEKDYFTSALPESQRGGQATIPIANADINYRDVARIRDDDGGLPTTPADVQIQSANPSFAVFGNKGTGDPYGIDNIESIDIDAVTINDLRKANKLQTWLEKSARGGSRYIEQIKSHFGITSSDARLQRPEYLGGGRQPVAISEVLNTTGTNEAPQGDMAGHGISVGRGNRFSRSFEEHGFVIGVISVLPKTAYSQGIERHFKKFDKFDYYWPEFANLGEQEILNMEIFFNKNSSPNANASVWGYQQRYAEYKYNKSSIHGDFRDTLEFWQMGRKFNGLPPLNEDFIKSDPTKRIFAVTDEETDDLYVQIYNKVDALRPMPYHSIPSL